MNCDVHVICGPTASGKSALACEMAEDLGGVVINADSMQVYNALPILTAQPTQEDKDRVPHRLYGHLPPAEKSSAPRWRETALEEIASCDRKGKVPVVVGGTGFYLKVLLEGLSPIPDVPREIRERSEKFLALEGRENLHALLNAKDPETAQKISSSDTQRLVRAWEVLMHTGKGLSWWQNQPPVSPPAGLRFHVHLVMPDRERIYRSCNERLDAMVRNGVLEEISAFDLEIRAGRIPQDTPLTFASGYRALQSGLRKECGMPEAVERAKAETRQYAKRQTTWFRHQIGHEKIESIHSFVHRS